MIRDQDIKIVGNLKEEMLQQFILVKCQIMEIHKQEPLSRNWVHSSMINLLLQQVKIW